MLRVGWIRTDYNEERAYYRNEQSVAHHIKIPKINLDEPLSGKVQTELMLWGCRTRSLKRLHPMTLWCCQDILFKKHFHLRKGLWLCFEAAQHQQCLLSLHLLSWEPPAPSNDPRRQSAENWWDLRIQPMPKSLTLAGIPTWPWRVTH